MPKLWDEYMIMAKVHAMINDMYEKDPSPWEPYIKSQEEQKAPEYNELPVNTPNKKPVDNPAGNDYITDIQADIQTEIDSILNGKDS